MVARVWRALVNVLVTKNTLKTFGTSTFISVGAIHTLGSILAWSAGTLVYIYLAHGASEAGGAGAGEAIHNILAYATIYTWVTVTLIHVDLTIRAGEA